jgi:hypothetical protein
MAALTVGMKVLARRLLNWDRLRIVDVKSEHPLEDVSAYEARQDIAEVCIDADVLAWPVEVVDLFHGALEATRIPRTTAMVERGLGRLRTRRTWPALTLAERLAYRELATAIGRIKYLQETAPRLWGDEDTGE